MKVAFYNHTSVVSGAEISLLLTAKHLKQATPIVFAPAGELLERAAVLGIEVSPIASYRAKLSSNPLRIAKDIIGMFGAGLRFALAIRNSGVDLVHANSLRAGIIAALFRWLHRRPVIWHVRDIPPAGVIGRGIQRLAARRVEAILNISKAVMDKFDHRILGSKLHLVPNGVELPRDDEPAAESRSREHIRLQLDTPADAKAIAIIGQIAPWKRQEDAIRAAGELVAQGHDVYLWVVGEAKFREENVRYGHSLVRLAEELGLSGRVRFAGFRQDVSAICRAADALLLCSDNEPFGRVLIEAMSHSLPVAATNAGGVPEIVEDGISGLLYPVGDVKALATCVTRLLTDKPLRERLVTTAKRRVGSQFTIQSTAERVEAVYGTIYRPDRLRNAELRERNSYES
ncbi:glycosyltransferase family 4 protein [Cohnella lubricantis]|nr:glycosyltransferase family 4 protein [Cohnella lubricantis]